MSVHGNKMSDSHKCTDTGRDVFRNCAACMCSFQDRLLSMFRPRALLWFVWFILTPSTFWLLRGTVQILILEFSRRTLAASIACGLKSSKRHLNFDLSLVQFESSTLQLCPNTILQESKNINSLEPLIPLFPERFLPSIDWRLFKSFFAIVGLQI